MAVAPLARPAMAAPVVSDDSIPLFEEVEHLGVPVIGAQWPAMMEHDGLRPLGAPVLVEDRDSVLRGDRVHRVLLEPCPENVDIRPSRSVSSAFLPRATSDLPLPGAIPETCKRLTAEGSRALRCCGRRVYPVAS